MDAIFDPYGHMAGSAARETRAYGAYMMLADARLNLFSVFDDLKYDRSDLDMLSPPMRRHAIERLAGLGFRQTSGRVLRNAAEDVLCYIPKFHALGASPFDITRDTPKRARDYYLLTPTQTACQFIDNYPLDDAVERIEALVQAQPVNLLKLVGYLEHTPAHRKIKNAMDHLIAVQKDAVASDALRGRKALSAF